MRRRRCGDVPIRSETAEEKLSLRPGMIFVPSNWDGTTIFEIFIVALNAPSTCLQGLRRNGADLGRTDARIEFAGIRVTCPDPVEGFASSLVLIRVHLLVGP